MAWNAKKNYGVTNVGISSILPRVFCTFQRNRHILNGLLRDLCDEHDFNFIDNDNILLQEHIDKDGIHLNGEGTDIFARNLVEYLNG